MLTKEDEQVVRAYADLCERKRCWHNMSWRGHDAAKTPEDMWLYQETICQLRPALIVEFGTNLAGSALFFSDILQLIGPPYGKVITIDNFPRPDLPQHSRLTYLIGHSRHNEQIDFVREQAAKAQGPVMFIEDSEHTGEHVGKELDLYADMVTVGSYFVVEDLDWPEKRSSIRVAVEEFLAEHREFQVDDTKDRYLMTVAPGGWIQRIK